MKTSAEIAQESLERRVCYCRACGARMVYLRTLNEKRIPIDAETVKPADYLFDPKTHRTHFATCPAAARFRRAKT